VAWWLSVNSNSSNRSGQSVSGMGPPAPCALAPGPLYIAPGRGTGRPLACRGREHARCFVLAAMGADKSGWAHFVLERRGLYTRQGRPRLRLELESRVATGGPLPYILRTAGNEL
jgi:hypothetical protein